MLRLPRVGKRVEFQRFDLTYSLVLQSLTALYGLFHAPGERTPDLADDLPS